MTEAAAPLTVTAATFMTDVVEASGQTPVLVDFWAPWCGPCKQLMPILDRLVEQYAGRFKLAKVNTDEQQELSQQIGVRSLPTVVLFKDRTVVDHFIGVVPESQIREMLDKHLPKTVDSPLQRAQQLKAAGDFAGARTIVENELARDRENIDLQTSLAELQALDGDVDGARKELERLQGANPSHPAVKRLAALLAFSDVVAAYPDVRSLRERAGANPADLDLRHALAVHQLLGGDVEPALLAWLEMLRDHRAYKEDLARRSLVMAFELIGEADPIVSQTRRAMARMLF
ncbi:MAG TPA: thioredoxin [Steroidobacteraceae bacterium]|nr:thioredoxin [Steroidobacteraceae bacterium]